MISDIRGLFPEGIRSPLARAGAGGGPGYLPQRHHLASDYLSAAIPLGLQVRRCVVPRGGRRAYRDVPILIVWHFQLSG